MATEQSVKNEELKTRINKQLQGPYLSQMRPFCVRNAEGLRMSLAFDGWA
jgi:hypothetical protein